MPSPLKIGVSLFLLWAALVFPAMAENMYVDEKFELPMRVGPGPDRKIIALVPGGSLVTIITKGDEWSEVSLPNGKQGFVLARYLTDQTPPSLALERLQNKHTALQAKNEDLQTKANELTSENKQLKETLSKTQGELSSLGSEHTALRKGSGEYLSLKEKHDKAVKDLAEVKQKAETFENEVNKLSHREFYDGMLYGGGILVLGIILGLIFRKPRRKQSLL